MTGSDVLTFKSDPRLVGLPLIVNGHDLLSLRTSYCTSRCVESKHGTCLLFYWDAESFLLEMD